MTRHSDRVDRFTNDLDELHDLIARGFLDNLDRAYREWSGRGYPSGGGDGTRSTRESSSTERAALAPDHIGTRLAQAEDALQHLSAAVRELQSHAAWLAPLSVEAARRMVGGVDTCRVDGCTDDAEPGHDSCCAACYEYRRRTGADPTGVVLERRWKVRIERSA